MGFLKKGKAPSELPELAIDGSSSPKETSRPIVPDEPKPIVPIAEKAPIVEPKKEGVEEDYLEFKNHPEPAKHEEIKAQIEEQVSNGTEIEQAGFFDQILDDVNDEIEDLGKLEDWYNNKFLPQDVVSEMRGYWESNKSDIIIQNFGAEYKRKINEKIKELRELEEDWREVYFKLIKKEEEMKKVEKELKGTLSEFVDLCKRRNLNNEKKEDKGNKPNEEGKGEK